MLELDSTKIKAAGAIELATTLYFTWAQLKEKYF